MKYEFRGGEITSMETGHTKVMTGRTISFVNNLERTEPAKCSSKSNGMTSDLNDHPILLHIRGLLERELSCMQHISKRVLQKQRHSKAILQAAINVYLKVITMETLTMGRSRVSMYVQKEYTSIFTIKSC